MICPSCGKKEMTRRRIPFVHADRYFGDYDADVCPHCGEILLTEEASNQLDERAKQLGLWGRVVHSSDFAIQGARNEADSVQIPAPSLFSLTSSAEVVKSKTKVLAIRLQTSTA